jgi:hypothetical protein
MHNPLPHNRIFTDIDKMINIEMYSLSNIIIVLGPSAKKIIKTRTSTNQYQLLNINHIGKFTGKNQIKTRLEVK